MSVTKPTYQRQTRYGYHKNRPSTPRRSSQKRSQDKCYNCGKIGHIASKCWSQKKSTSPKPISSQRATSKSPNRRKNIHWKNGFNICSSNSNLITTNAIVNSYNLLAAIDTGADVSVMSLDIAIGLGISFDNSAEKMIGSDGSALEVIGCSEPVLVTVEDTTASIVFAITRLSSKGGTLAHFYVNEVLPPPPVC